jgi:hypothetical protein
MVDYFDNLAEQMNNGRKHRAVRVLPLTDPLNTALKDAPEDGPMRSETL